VSTPGHLEAWLRGPVPGVSTLLQPAAHALLHASEDVEAARGLKQDELHARPGGAASVAYHLLHLAGSLDRLLTYARGEPLSEEQRAALKDEADPSTLGLDAGKLVDRVQSVVQAAIDQLRATPEASIIEGRLIGRRAIPSTVAGVLFHAGEHSARHAGQVLTTIRVIRGG
jgi:uncharacterized damage-inducible protein DinB